MKPLCPIEIDKIPNDLTTYLYVNLCVLSIDFVPNLWYSEKLENTMKGISSHDPRFCNVVDSVIDLNIDLDIPLLLDTEFNFIFMALKNRLINWENSFFKN